MAAQVTISQLPTAGPLTGTELVPVVQNGGTVKTTVADIAASPNNTQTFLTVNQEPSLANSRYLAGNNGITLSDGGAQNPLVVELTGAALQFFNAPAGLIAKPTATTVAARILLAGGSGLSITNGNGVLGDPIIALAGRNAALEAVSGTSGLLALAGTGLTSVDILGTANQISVANGGGPGNPTIGIAANPVLPGTGGFVPPIGTTAERPALPTPGTTRYNTDISSIEIYDTGSGWTPINTGAVTLINTGTGLTGGPITSTGTISIADTGIGAGTYGSASQVSQLIINAQGQATNGFNVPIAIDASQIVSGSLPTQYGGTGANNLTGYVYGNGASSMTASPTIPSTDLDNYSITVNGVTIDLGGSGTISATAANPLTIGTGLSGTSYDGSAPVTIAIDSTVATLTGSQILTNKTINGNDNTLSNIGNSSLTNSSVTFNGVAVALGGSGTITAASPSALTIGTGLSGTSYDGASPTTIAISNTGVSANTYGAADKTLTLAVNAQGQLTSVSASSIAISYTQVSGLGSAATLNAGSANGVATLDSGGQVPLTQLPTAIQGALNYQGVWNASTNTPTLSSGVGTKGYFYVVDVAGSTNLDGITSWNIGDWAVFNGTVWQKIDNTDAVASVNGYTGIVVLGYADVGAPSTSGTNATGTWNISISGNAATVTNGVYTNGSYADPTWLTSLATTKLSGTVAVANGGTNLSSYTVGDILWASGATTLSKLGIGSNTYIMTSSGAAPQWSNPTGITVGNATNAVNATNATNATTATNIASGTAGALPYNTGAGATTFLSLGASGYVLTAGASAPQYVAQSTLSVGSATNATNTTNVAITSSSTNADYYLTMVSTNTGNLPEYVATGLTANPSTGKITSGIAGGTF